jgi:hypothetical protein
LSSSSEKSIRSRKLGRRLHRFRRVAEEPRHLGRRLQVPLGIGLEQLSRIGDGHALADAGHHILQVALFGRMIEHVVDGDQTHPGLCRLPLQRGQPAPVAALAQHRGAQPDPGRCLPQSCEQFRHSPLSRHHDQEEVAGARQKVVETQETLALRRLHLADGQKPAEIAPAGAVLRIRNDLRRSIGKDQPCADHEPEGRDSRRPMFFDDLRLDASDRIMGPHHARHRVAVGHADPCMTELHRLPNQIGGRGGSAQEGEVAGHRQFGIGGHESRLLCRLSLFIYTLLWIWGPEMWRPTAAS